MIMYLFIRSFTRISYIDFNFLEVAEWRYVFFSITKAFLRIAHLIYFVQIEKIH